MNNKNMPPIAQKDSIILTKHNETRTDDYFWLKDRDNPKVIEYLQAENKYTADIMKDVEPLIETIFTEIKGRIKQTDASVPYKEKTHYYYTRYEDGLDYPIYCRKKDNLNAPEEILLDVNRLAEGKTFIDVENLTISNDEAILAYSIDLQGRGIYNLYAKDINSESPLIHSTIEMTGNMVWANDNKTLFYSKADSTTLRSYQIYRHRLGETEDVLIYEELDDTYGCYVTKTKSERYILICSYHRTSSEYRFIDANDPDGTFAVFTPRQSNHEYYIDHVGDKFYIRTNQDAENFQLMVCSDKKTERLSWEPLVTHRADVLLEDVELFNDYLVLEERQQGLVHLQICNLQGKFSQNLKFADPAYLVGIDINPEANTNILRFSYSSMTTPRSIYDYNMQTGEQILKKRQEVLGSFNPEDYQVERIYAEAKDGVQIPISLVYKKSQRNLEGNKLLLYGYGAYGISLDATFSASRLTLLDRGFIFAIAHVRGGEELGRSWYEDGKYLKKKNTFTDFIASAEHLIVQKYADPQQIFAMGGSAGGLLIGAVVNMRPDLFKGVVAQVPFVDVITTMLDPSIPLTTGEYDEWGNPNDQEYYTYIRSYSPYDNVAKQNYPHMLVTTGLQDAQVQYWEPAKWVAKLREYKTDKNLLLLKTDMDSGHGGASGRDKQYRETAFEYAFLLKLSQVL